MWRFTSSSSRNNSHFNSISVSFFKKFIFTILFFKKTSSFCLPQKQTIHSHCLQKEHYSIKLLLFSPPNLKMAFTQNCLTYIFYFNACKFSNNPLPSSIHLFWRVKLSHPKRYSCPRALFNHFRDPFNNITSTNYRLFKCNY